MESNQLKISKNYDKNNESFDEEYARTQNWEHWIEEQEDRAIQQERERIKKRRWK